MALNEELLKQNTALQGLTPEQIKAVEELSTNDERATVERAIGKKTGELYGGIEKDLFDTTGVEKQQGEKAYDYLKRALGDYSALKGQSGEHEALKAKAAELEEKIKGGKGSEAIAQQLKDAEQKISALEQQSREAASSWEEKYNSAVADNKNIRLDREFAEALTGIEFRKDLPEDLRGKLVQMAKQEITKKYTPDWVENGGKTDFVLRNEKGEVALNRENSLKPFGLAELMKAELSGSLAEGRQTPGAGTRDQGQNYASIGGAKTQIEADTIIANTLIEQGIARGTVEFVKKSTAMRKEANVSELPTQ